MLTCNDWACVATDTCVSQEYRKSKIQKSLIDRFYVIEWSYRVVSALHSKKSNGPVVRALEAKLFSLVNIDGVKLLCNFERFSTIIHDLNMEVLDETITPKTPNNKFVKNRPVNQKNSKIKIFVLPKWAQMNAKASWKSCEHNMNVFSTFPSTFEAILDNLLLNPTL